MKRIYTILVSILLTASVFAQSPEKMSYQAVVRDISNNLVTNQAVGMKISILQGSISGSSVYEEIFNPNPITNSNGLVTVEIGGGVPLLGAFATIDWSAGPYFIKTETDPTGGTNYTITGISQLLSVPYALHAKTADTVTGGITETDPIFVASPANGITSNNITNWDNKLDTESQILSISNDTIYLTGGSFVKLPAGFSGDYSDLTNKPDFTDWDTNVSDDFDGDYNNLTNKPTVVSTFTNDAGYLTSFTESQILSISNDTIYLTGGSFVKLPAKFSGDYNDLINKPTNVSSFTNDAGYVTTDSLTLSINGNDLSISGGNTVTLTNGGSSGGFQIFSASGTFTVPEGVTQIIVEVWGAGAGGQAGSPQYGGDGGSGGGYGKEYLNVTSGQILTVTVGIGGAGGTGSYGQGASGGSTSVGTLVTATGGTGSYSGGTSTATIFEQGDSGGENPVDCSSVAGGDVGGPHGNWGKGGTSGTCGSNPGTQGQNGYCIICW